MSEAAGNGASTSEQRAHDKKPSISGRGDGDIVTESRDDRSDNVLEEVVSGIQKMELKKDPLSDIAAGIANGRFKNVCVMTGAGISTAAGIKDFRSPGTGLFDNLGKYNLSSPEDIFTLRYFKKNPLPFYDLAREIFKDSYAPTVCHYFLRLLDIHGVLLRLYTQNIDGLERLTGLGPERVVEAHGHFRTAHCIRCRKEYDEQWLRQKVFKEKVTPKCECEWTVKPDITFYGEALPETFFQNVTSDFPKCDLLLVFGTSLTVTPFCHLVSFVADGVPRVLVNKTCSAGFSADTPNQLFVEDSCDDGCKRLAALLGWEDELNELVATETAKLQAKASL